MAAYVKFEKFVEALAEGEINLETDTLKVLLTDTAPSPTTWENYANVTGEITGTGYTAGGEPLTETSSLETTGTYKLVSTAPTPTWTAGAGDWTSFRYVVLYDDTSASKRLLAYFDYGSEVLLANGETFTVVPDAINGVLQIS